jgi:hypothetical protein
MVAFDGGQCFVFLSLLLRHLQPQGEGVPTHFWRFLGLVTQDSRNRGFRVLFLGLGAL